MNVVDSSGWIEYFKEGGRADVFAPAIEDVARLVVPTICIREVSRFLMKESDPARLLEFLDGVRYAVVIDLTQALAVAAAELSIRHRLPLADSIIYATAVAYGAELWTQDADFEGLPGVRYFPRKAAESGGEDRTS